MLAALALLSSGCGPDEPADDPPPPPGAPEEQGPYSIGVTTISVASEGRELPVEIWYPAGGGGAAEEYVLKIGVLELARFDSPLGAKRDASLDARGAPYPTVVFSHGSGGTRIQSIYLTEYLATHGFVVVAPDHVGNTIAEEINSAKALPTAEAARVRPEDVSHALDAALGAPLLEGRLDETRVGVAGHSFGGFTAFRIAGATIDTEAVLAACAASGGLVCKGWDQVNMPNSQRDARFSAALAQAPGGANSIFAGEGDGFSAVQAAVMIQGGTSDQLTPYDTEQQAPYDALPSPAELVGIDKAGHFTFSNMCELVELLGLSDPAFDDGCGPANIPWQEAHPIIVAYSTAFFQTTLVGLPPPPLLDPSTPLASGVEAFSSK